MNPLTWQNPEQLFVAQVLKKIFYNSVAELRYIKEGFEPNVPSVEERIETFKQLSDKIGKEKVIWRFDPLIITPTIGPRELLTRIWHIGNKLKGYTN